MVFTLPGETVLILHTVDSRSKTPETPVNPKALRISLGVSIKTINMTASKTWNPCCQSTCYFTLNNHICRVDNIFTSRPLNIYRVIDAKKCYATTSLEMHKTQNKRKVEFSIRIQNESYECKCFLHTCAMQR